MKAMPNIIKFLFFLILISTVFGFISSFQKRGFDLNSTKYVFTLSFTLIVYSALIFYMWKRKNWARITMVVLLTISLPGYAVALTMLKDLPLTYYLQIITNITLLILLFLKPIKLWFKKSPSL